MPPLFLTPMLTLACADLASYDVTSADDRGLPDAGGSDADIDADSDSDADADADTDTDTAPVDTGPVVPCGEFPDQRAPVLDPGSGTMNPSALMLFASGIVESGVVHDYTLWDLEGDSPIRNESALLHFVFLDVAGDPICEVAYDLSEIAGPGGRWNVDAPVELFDWWDLSLANGESDCPSLAQRFGVNSALVFLQQYRWNIGFGPMTVPGANLLEYLVTTGGEDWEQDYLPYVFSLYVESDLFAPASVVELGYAFAFARTCENLHTDATGTVGFDAPIPDGPMGDFVSALPLQPIFLIF